MRDLKSLLLALVSALTVVACTVGESSTGTSDEVVTYVDSDGDGITDGVDTDGDGDIDHSTAACPTCAPGGAPVCLDPLVDADGDGAIDGIDLDCDGNIDIPLAGGGAGGGGGGSSTYQCVSTIFNGDEKKQVSCTNGECECRLNDQLVQTCTATAGGCSIPGNCCGF